MRRQGWSAELQRKFVPFVCHPYRLLSLQCLVCIRMPDRLAEPIEFSVHRALGVWFNREPKEHERLGQHALQFARLNLPRIARSGLMTSGAKLQAIEDLVQDILALEQNALHIVGDVAVRALLELHFLCVGDAKTDCRHACPCCSTDVLQHSQHRQGFQAIMSYSGLTWI